MITKNGKNKTERTINKLKKYFNVDVENSSNQYFKVANSKELNNLYIINKDFVKVVKNGELLVIDPENNDGKVFFVKSWKAFVNENGEYIFDLYHQNDKERMNELVKGSDSVELVSNLNREIRVSKKDCFIKSLASYSYGFGG